MLVSFVHQNEEKTEFHKANTFGSGKLFKKQFDGTAIIEGVKVGTNFAMTTLHWWNLTVNFLKMSPLTSAKMTHNGEVLEGVLNEGELILIVLKMSQVLTHLTLKRLKN